MPLELTLAYSHSDIIRTLFSEYTQMLVDHDPAFAQYLEFQHYGTEIDHLAEKYGLPDGRLYLAMLDGQPVGCVGLRRIDANRCELKRLYVRPTARRHGIAGRLIAQIISDAKYIGYRTMLLDTLPFLQDAIRLYQALGFYEVPSYNNSPLSESIFLRLDLDRADSVSQEAGTLT